MNCPEGNCPRWEFSVGGGGGGGGGQLSGKNCLGGSYLGDCLGGILIVGQIC